MFGIDPGSLPSPYKSLYAQSCCMTAQAWLCMFFVQACSKQAGIEGMRPQLFHELQEPYIDPVNGYNQYRTFGHLFGDRMLPQ